MFDCLLKPAGNLRHRSCTTNTARSIREWKRGPVQFSEWNTCRMYHWLVSRSSRHTSRTIRHPVPGTATVWHIHICMNCTCCITVFQPLQLPWNVISVQLGTLSAHVRNSLADSSLEAMMMARCNRDLLDWWSERYSDLRGITCAIFTLLCFKRLVLSLLCNLVKLVHVKFIANG